MPTAESFHGREGKEPYFKVVDIGLEGKTSKACCKELWAEGGEL